MRGKVEIERQLSFRKPMRVTQIICYRSFVSNGGISRSFAVCPRCNVTMEREYQSYCDRCGQALNWNGYFKAVVTYVDEKKTRERLKK